MTRLTAGVPVGHLIAQGENLGPGGDAGSNCMGTIRASDFAGG